MRYAIIGFVLILGGCAGYSQDMGALVDKSVSVPTLNAIPPVGLVLNEAKEHEITQASPTYRFPTGTSFTAVFELPAFQPGRVLEVKSYCHCLGLTKGVFIPIAITLDANYQQVRRLDFDTHTQTMWQPVHYIGGILTKSSEKYVVLYTDPKRFGKAADPVYVAVVNKSVERMDYIRKGYTRTTYTDRQAGVWWEGDAIGEFLLVIKDKSYIDESK